VKPGNVVSAELHRDPRRGSGGSGFHPDYGSFTGDFKLAAVARPRHHQLDRQRLPVLDDQVAVKEGTQRVEIAQEDGLRFRWFRRWTDGSRQGVVDSRFPALFRQIAPHDIDGSLTFLEQANPPNRIITVAVREPIRKLLIFLKTTMFSTSREDEIFSAY
jgi:hypothetical protein